jgi:hypothetical protein
MAESFEEAKIISNPLANLHTENAVQCKVGGFGKSEQTGGLHNHCKGSDAKGMYTDTNKNQANDFWDLLQNAQPMPGLMV